MTSSAKSRVLSIGVSGSPDALDRFEAAWHLATGRTLPPVERLSFADLPLLLKSLSPARWQLLATLRRDGPMSVRSLAKRLERDYKNVHTDVAQMTGLRLIERAGKALVQVPWDEVRADLKL